MTGDALLELVGVRVAQAGIHRVHHQLLAEVDIGVVGVIVGAVDHDARALALAQRVLDGELAGKRRAAGQGDLHQIPRGELPLALAELDMRAVIAERVPGTVLIAFHPQSLAHA